MSRLLPPREKFCNQCSTLKSVDEFYRRGPQGLLSECKSCNHNRCRTGQKYKSLRQHGVTVDWYIATLTEQGGGCAICGKTEEENGKLLAVDHDHACCPGKFSCGECVRGLLCHGCNVAIGHLQDSPRLLVNAMSYITREGTGTKQQKPPAANEKPSGDTK